MKCEICGEREALVQVVNDDEVTNACIGCAAEMPYEPGQTVERISESE